MQTERLSSFDPAPSILHHVLLFNFLEQKSATGSCIRFTYDIRASIYLPQGATLHLQSQISLKVQGVFFSSTHVAASLWVMWDCAISPLVCRLSLALVFAMTFQQKSLMISCLYIQLFTQRSVAKPSSEVVWDWKLPACCWTTSPTKFCTETGNRCPYISHIHVLNISVAWTHTSACGFADILALS